MTLRTKLASLTILLYTFFPMLAQADAASESNALQTQQLRLYSEAMPNILDVWHGVAGLSEPHQKELARVDQDLLADAEINYAPILEAHTVILSQILEMHPQHLIFFLARDAETLFHLGKLMTFHNLHATKAGEAQRKLDDHYRLVLANISRKVMEDSRLWQYVSSLRDEANKERKKHNLAPIQKILFVDSGLVGSVIDAVAKQCPAKERPNIEGFLYLSFNKERYADSRTFWTSFESAAVFSKGSEFEDTLIYSIENLPHLTSRATGLVEVNGRLEVVFPAITIKADDEDEDMAAEDDSPEADEKHYNQQENASVNEKDAMAWMRELVRYSASREARELFLSHSQHWRAVHDNFFQLSLESVEKIEREFFLRMQSQNEKHSLAMLRDFLTFVKTYYPAKLRNIKPLVKIWNIAREVQNEGQSDTRRMLFLKDAAALSAVLDS